MRFYPFNFLIGCVICTSVFLSLPAQAKMFKWKDENGQTHYGDRIPTRYLNDERKEIGKQGLVVKTTDRALTAEEREAKHSENLIAKEKAKTLKERQKRDRVLLDTYTTERDLIIARDARIDAVNSQLKLSESIIESAQKKLERTEKRIEKIEARKKKVPDDVHKKLKREQQQLETHHKVADGHKKKRGLISAQFEGYISRFNELKNMQDQRRKEAEQRRRMGQ